MNPLVSFFDWLRRKTCAAILGGVADAAAQLDNDAAAPGPLAPLPEALLRRLALPPPVADNAEPEPEAASNGKPRKSR